MKIKHILRIVAIVGLLLLIPLWGNSNVEGWNWSPFDFVFAFVVFFIFGLAFQFVLNSSGAIAYKFAGCLAIVTAFFLTWINAAVGIIGDGNPANVLYPLLVLILLAGATVSRLERHTMSHVLFGVAVGQMIIPLIAFIFWPDNFAPGVFPVFVISAYFSLSWITSALLFRKDSN